MFGFSLTRRLNTTRPRELTQTDLAGLLESTPSDTLLRLAYADWLEESGEVPLANGQRWQAANKKYPFFTNNTNNEWSWHVIDFPSTPLVTELFWSELYLRLPYQLIDWMGRNTTTVRATFDKGHGIYTIVWYSSSVEAEQALAVALDALGMTP